MEIKFTTTENMRMDTSFGSYGHEYDVEIQYLIKINENGHGSFEMYDIETDGDKWYADGGLWFNGKSLVDYDGVFSLPNAIIEKLNEMGYQTDEI